jgi:tRNA threonylcarbamoyladenosine biosynthesis protein TsaB
MSYFLAVDTATEACSVAVSMDGHIHELHEVAERGHTRRLLPMIQQILAAAGRPLSQLDGIVCGIGPGSFSGVRIGVGLVKGLALAADKPVAGVSSLAMLAQQAIRLRQETDIVPAIDARMNEVYLGVYRRGGDGLAIMQRPDGVSTADAVAPLPAGAWTGLGTGWAVHGGALRAALQQPITAAESSALPHAQDALTLALPEFASGRSIGADSLAPAYLRNRVALTLAEQKAR